MKYAQFRELVENADGEIHDILSIVLDNLRNSHLEWEEIDETEVYEEILDVVDGYFTYYSDAWDYLQVNGITDFSEAYDEWEATDVCVIATYYAYQDACDYVSQNWSEYEFYEDEEDEFNV